MKVFVGNDWAKDHHDVEVQDEAGRRLASARLDEGIAGITRFHELIAAVFAERGEQPDPGAVFVCIEKDHGPWVAALVAAGYRVFAINPLQIASYRKRISVSGAKSDPADAHALADLVRLDAHQLREVAGDSDQAQGLKVLARAHQTLIWERTRQVLRLQQNLGEYFPAALAAFDDFAAPDVLALLDKAPDPASAAAAIGDAKRAICFRIIEK